MSSISDGMKQTIEARIGRSTKFHLESIQNIEKEKLRVEAEKELQQQKDKLTQEAKYQQKCQNIKSIMKRYFYDELVGLITEEKLVDKIGEAKAKGKKYALICNVSFNNENLLRNRKKVVFTFDPEEISIYDKLVYRLREFPDNYQINIEEPWCFGTNAYKFRMYISWGELTLKDKLELECDNMGDHLMGSDLKQLNKKV